MCVSCNTHSISIHIQFFRLLFTFPLLASIFPQLQFDESCVTRGPANPELRGEEEKKRERQERKKKERRAQVDMSRKQEKGKSTKLKRRTTRRDWERKGRTLPSLSLSLCSLPPVRLISRKHQLLGHKSKREHSTRCKLLCPLLSFSLSFFLYNCSHYDFAHSTLVTLVSSTAQVTTVTRSTRSARHIASFNTSNARMSNV